MRDLKLVHIDEPFTKLLTQGMVLNEAFVREQRAGGARVLLGARARHRARRAPARSSRPGIEARRQAGAVRRLDDDVQVEEQRRRPAGTDRPLRRRHGAPVRDVRLAARADAGVERRRRRRRATASCAGCGTSAHRHRRGAGRRRRRRGRRAATALRAAHRAAPGQLRLRAHAIQHRRLRRDEDAQRAGRLQGRRQRPTAPCCARASALLLRALYPACPHITLRAVAGAGLTPPSTATCSTRPGRRSTKRRWCRTRSS